VTVAGRPDGPDGSGGRGGLSIGAVLARLKPEFPDVTISKLRFLESEGLLRPARTPSGYRQFSAADVERLRFVLQAQRDHYLPLKVIKARLDGAADGDTPAAAPSRVPLAARAGVDVGDPAEEAAGPIRLTREDIMALSGVDSAMLAELEQYGLVRPGRAGFYDPASVRLAEIAKAMTEFGIEPRHLRTFRAAADRQVSLLEQAVAPMYRQHDPSSSARAEETLRELAGLTVALHSLLVRVGLRGDAGA
jgi:DNA-binding transcriptional MerR regulator